MTRSESLLAVIVAFAVGVLGALSLRPAAEPGRRPALESHVDQKDGAEREAIHWRVSSAFAKHLPALGGNVAEVADRLRRASRGAIDWSIDDPGEVVPAFAIVDAVRGGKIDAGYTWLGYDQGRLAVSVLFGAVPFGMTPWEYSAWWTRGGGRELARSIYRPLGVEPILCGLIGPETAGWFRHEIERPADLEGLKIRFAGIGGRALQQLGASVTMMPGGEIFQALEKGAIDATEYSLPEVDARLGFDRVARYNYYPGWHQPFTAFHLVVHAATWDALADSTRATIELACDAGVTRNLASTEAIQGEVIAELGARGVETRSLSPALLAALESAAQDVMEELAAEDVDFDRVLAHQRRFRKRYARWRTLAYPTSPADSGDLSESAERARGAGGGTEEIAGDHGGDRGR
ncbi:MAG: TRAP transporter substrate-binding protein [Deltaproteobacteria bacterium]|jgi:TRAP-type mannitol/chloroaromatic compound transport system substrate-binding protein|nr:TRAP transporter substrate-binding protein [Deltaproteobacteria bacterium]MBW2496394.1 TRAP transporter substrate-binding protein [Deltaproteobacteria bacterium]